MGACVTSYPQENNMKQSNLDGQPMMVDADNKLLELFINKYKLHQLSNQLYIEGITVKFLLSQNEKTIDEISKQLTSNPIQLNKFKYAVQSEKKAQQRKIHLDERKISSSLVPAQNNIKNETFIIYIKSLNGKLSSLSVTSTDLISNVKMSYQQKENIAVERQLLTFCGTQLLNDKCLSFYGIINNAHLSLLDYDEIINYKRKHNGNDHRFNDEGIRKLAMKKCRNRKKPKRKQNSNELNLINLSVQTFRKNALFKLKMKKTLKIGTLKKIIQTKWGISPCIQRLTVNGQELDDQRSLSYYDIRNKDVVYLTEQMGLYTTIIDIKMLGKNDAKSVTIGVATDDSIKNIKKQIKLYLNVEIKKQKLIHCGKELKNNQTVHQCKIYDGNTVHLVMI